MKSCELRLSHLLSFLHNNNNNNGRLISWCSSYYYYLIIPSSQPVMSHHLSVSPLICVSSLLPCGTMHLPPAKLSQGTEFPLRQWTHTTQTH
ncbi:hypothetical protein Pmani_028387 [Petrolisthes manimaculis]|uniref:Uncharacterized protein n=1 Tax=Petrolisthes manimaculis TaxID=1843537 RepID=A0AAE1TUX3_9EUCA|nr:hypothetical protein Pmani_028387 [Petrolisthes manimaculis]